MIQVGKNILPTWFYVAQCDFTLIMTGESACDVACAFPCHD